MLRINVEMLISWVELPVLIHIKHLFKMKFIFADQ